MDSNYDADLRDQQYEAFQSFKGSTIDNRLLEIESIEGLDDIVPIKKFVVDNDASKVFDFEEQSIDIAKFVSSVKKHG